MIPPLPFSGQELMFFLQVWRYLRRKREITQNNILTVQMTNIGRMFLHISFQWLNLFRLYLRYLERKRKKKRWIKPHNLLRIMLAYRLYAMCFFH